MYVVDLSQEHVKPLCNGRHPCYTSYPKESPQATNEPIKNCQTLLTCIDANVHLYKDKIIHYDENKRTKARIQDTEIKG